MALTIMYCVDVPLHAASGLFMFTLPPKRGTIRKLKIIKKAEYDTSPKLAFKKTSRQQSVYNSESA